MIMQRFKTEIRYSQQCEALAMDIEESTGLNLSTTTLKRMMGFANSNIQPRQSSLDIVAQYLGYKDYRELQLMLEYLPDRDPKSDKSSGFGAVDGVNSVEIDPGTRVRISYAPGRVVELSYLGKNQYLVTDSRKSKLLKGDRITVAAMYAGFELLVSNVERNGRSLGAYHAARDGGLTSVEIF